MKDFTIDIYHELILALKNAGFMFQTYAEFVKQPAPKSIILRHDVDAQKENSFEFAQIQHQLGIKGTFYFRTIPKSFDVRLMKEMENMGHEIGYHYETMDTCNGNVDEAYREFTKHLKHFREIVNVKTICMHGSPMSKYDNRDLWKKYSYKDLDILAEPYFDIDFNKLFYLTDTGRRWDGGKVSVRDKVMEGKEITNNDFLNRKYHTTQQIISDLKHNDFPPQVMLTFHPQRWSNNPLLWYKELIWQNTKNLIKFLISK